MHVESWSMDVLQGFSAICEEARDVKEYPSSGDRLLRPELDTELGFARMDFIVGHAVVEAVSGGPAVPQAVDLRCRLEEELAEYVVPRLGVRAEDLVLGCPPCLGHRRIEGSE
jgi:hypothetical protein